MSKQQRGDGPEHEHGGADQFDIDLRLGAATPEQNTNNTNTQNDCGPFGTQESCCTYCPATCAQTCYNTCQTCPNEATCATCAGQATCEGMATCAGGATCAATCAQTCQTCVSCDGTCDNTCHQHTCHGGGTCITCPVRRPPYRG